ncbi:LAME_0B01266g1_1 [Lachancea meyersii CBS 8951]|uniref:LAME_0B01266g1_1 n=1 Tax=Lachancea meyersii CBS 8951 TaxID=1266667 RepID=A0A1G4ITI3_9SACH|nr:LAME_0B01266g1_1 [Lachancea meyersii CBS 8951]
MLRGQLPVKSLQELTARVLGGAKLVEKVGRSSLRSPSAALLSRTDIWLKEALVKKGDRLRTQKILRRKELHKKGPPELSLDAVLVNLRKLRLAKNVDAYYTLLNRLQSSQIRWRSRSGSFIIHQTPVELYRELSYMLRAQCADLHDRSDIVCLARFTLVVLRKYSEILEKRSTLAPDIVFWENCGAILTRTGSIYYLKRFLELVNHEPSKIYAYIAFYLQTDQISHLSSILKSSDMLRSQPLPGVLVPLIHQCVNRFVCLGLEGDAQMALELLMKQGIPDLSTIYRIDHLSQKYGAFKLQLELNRARNEQGPAVSIPWKTFQRNLSFGDYIELLVESRVQFFEESPAMDFLSTKLPVEAMSTNWWCSFFEKTMPPESSCPSLKAFHLNTILSHVAAHRSLGFVLLFWHRLILNFDCTEDFKNTHKLASCKNQGGFHILLHAAGKSSAAKLAGCELFNFIKEAKWPESSHDVPHYTLTDKDYANLIRSTLPGEDFRTMYFYLRHYLLDFGKECIHVDREGKLNWNLTSAVGNVLEKVRAMEKNAAELDVILKQVGEWHLTNYSQTNEAVIPERTLKDIFGAFHIQDLTPKQLLSLESRNLEESRQSGDSGSRYSLIADWENAERIRSTLDHMRNKLSKSC